MKLKDSKLMTMLRGKIRSIIGFNPPFSLADWDRNWAYYSLGREKLKYKCSSQIWQ